ncbi:MAG TPA: hypothetical protein VGA60_06805 [Kiloniellales bacterium]
MVRAMPGLSPELFSELLALWERLREEFGEDRIAGPFVPIVGECYGESGVPKVMFVGKATYGWDASPGMSLGERLDQARAFYEDIANNRYRPTFWRFLCRMTGKIHGVVGLSSSEQPGWALERLIWSNLFLIGAARSQPGKALARAQHDLMGKLLHYQLHTFRPDAIILMSNEYEGDFVERVFGTEHKRKLPGVLGPWTDVIDLSSIGARLYWTRHPQGWPNPEPEEQAICQDIRAFFTRA